jgi:methionyl-tRNA synthetase
VLAKDLERAGELDQALASLAEGLRIAAILLWPYMPGSSGRALASLGQGSEQPSLVAATWGAGSSPARVDPSGPLFPRVEPEE